MDREALIKLISEEVLKELRKYSFPVIQPQHNVMSEKKESIQSPPKINIPKNTIEIPNKIVSEKLLKDIVDENTKEVKIKKGSIITPAAKDYLTNRRIKITIE
ncbi:MAG TPA: hypothetical protein PLD27_10630 [bacterium]|nr:hypothetical protein [bacterium]HOL48856.1 hypothetical protein [bacterium]HPQ19683.1 hypothetical protein [bacterium]